MTYATDHWLQAASGNAAIAAKAPDAPAPGPEMMARIATPRSLVRDRIAIAYPKEAETPGSADMVGFAIWASVSYECDARIRDQIKAGTYPVRLKADDWTGGDNNWVLDIVAPDEAQAAKVLANFGQLAKGGSLKLHPAVARGLSDEVLEKMGAERTAPAIEGEN